MPSFLGQSGRNIRARLRLSAARFGFACTLLGVVVAVGAAVDNFDAQRSRMIAEIEVMTRETHRETGRAVLSPRVVAALRNVDRHRFVPPSQVAEAYDNRPLAIGAGQTISQPFIVALMTDLLNIGPGDRVLEIGTGSGYQAAILAEIAGAVYTIEIIESLALKAASALRAAGYRNVHTRIGDGYAGWPEAMPFDAIIVTAAAPEVPQPLIDQLRTGGHLVIPVGAPRGAQSLYVIHKDIRGTITRRNVLDVRFVPLTRGRENP